jgi:XTP/dITP diphosphohydrolase
VRRLLLATRNQGKLREMRELLGGLDMRLETLAIHPEVGEVEETGDTFEANARLKAVEVAKATSLWTVGEDSGLCVDALDGAPGVRSARYAGIHGDDAGNNARLLRELEGVTDRSARYVCTLCLARPDGTMVGGQGGFGYDPLFIPERMPEVTMAELLPEQKNLLSHRGQALHAFIPLLKAHLDDADA